MITISECIWCIEFFRAPSGSQGRIAFPRALILRQHCLCEHLNRGFHREGKCFNQSDAFHTALSFKPREHGPLASLCLPFPAVTVCFPPPTLPKRFLKHTFYQARGCPKCHFKGFNGRILLYEILPISKECKTLIAQEAPKESFLQLLEKEGFISLFENGIYQASLGLTSLEEVLRVTLEI